MMRAALLRRTLGVLLLLSAPVVLRAQTAGSGALSSIEAKVRAIDENDKQVVALNQKRMASYEAEANYAAARCVPV